MTSRLLIRGGVVIDTAPAPHAIGPADMLVEDGRIAAAGLARAVGRVSRRTRERRQRG